MKFIIISFFCVDVLLDGIIVKRLSNLCFVHYIYKGQKQNTQKQKESVVEVW